MSKGVANRILSDIGWLSERPHAFRAEVLQRSKLQRYAPGEVVFHLGDPTGGIYGLVDGIVAIDIAPPMSIPRLSHLGAPGLWTGEVCFFNRQPRRGELRALADTWLMHLSLDAMDNIAANDPNAMRHFAQILVFTLATSVRIIHDLQKSETSRRIASVLDRASWIGDRAIPLSQTELGAMANASRKQVNAALQRFSKEGWLLHTYRSVTIRNGEALRRFAKGEDDF